MAKLKTYLTANVEGWRDGFNKAGKSVRILRRRFDQMKHRFKRSFKTLGRMAGRFAKLGGAMAGAAVVGTLALSARNAVKFSEAMAEVNTIAGVTPGRLEELGQEAMRVANILGQGLDETTKGLYDTLSAGVPEENAIAYLEGAGKAAIAGVTSIDVAVDGLTSTMNAYRLEAHKVNDVSDMMFNIVKEGKITFPELAENIGKVAPTAKAAGVSMELMGAAIATAVQVEKPERAMTAIRAAMFKASEEGKGFLSFLEEFKGASLEEIQAAGVAKRAAQGVALLSGNWEEFSEQIKKAANDAGMAEEAFQTMAATPAFQIKQLKSTFETTTTQLGQAFLPMINQVTQGLLNMLAGGDPTERMNKIRAFATTMVLTFTGFIGNAMKGINNLQMRFKSVTGMMKLLWKGAVATIRLYFMGALAGLTIGLELFINAAIKGLNKVRSKENQLQQVKFASGFAAEAKAAAEDLEKAGDDLLEMVPVQEAMAEAAEKNLAIDTKQEELEEKVLAQAKMQEEAAARLAIQKQNDLRNESKKTDEVSKQTDEVSKQTDLLQKQAEIRFGKAIEAGSLEAYQAKLAQMGISQTDSIAKTQNIGPLSEGETESPKQQRIYTDAEAWNTRMSEEIERQQSEMAAGLIPGLPEGLKRDRAEMAAIEEKYGAEEAFSRGTGGPEGADLKNLEKTNQTGNKHLASIDENIAGMAKAMPQPLELTG